MDYSYRIHTLGCKVNQYETQALEAMLHENAISPAADGDIADLVIVNTCAVTAESGRKSRQALRRLKTENPGALAAVCGCFSQLSPEEAREIGADVIHGSGDKRLFCEDIIKGLERRRKAKARPEDMMKPTPEDIPGVIDMQDSLADELSFIDDPFKRRVFEELPAGAVTGRTRAMLKIQDGCVNFCTYCIIPYTRGAIRSLPLDRCAAAAARLSEQGYSELVITGIEIASYGRDLGSEIFLINAIEAIAASCGDMRLRLGSLEPRVITEEFCQRLSQAGKVCDHFHLSLQSGCDRTLKSMNRKYNTSEFFNSAQLLRKYFPGCGLTADLIVGFPGETQEDFEETLSFIKACAFSSMHIFPYSPRPGTKAAAMDNQLTHAQKAERAAQAQIIADKMENEFLHSCVGKILPVLFETASRGVSTGHASNYAQVSVSGEHSSGLVRNVKITDTSGKMLVGIMI